jgi:glycosyltransferase involved in cell wall biosynthesis
VRDHFDVVHIHSMPVRLLGMVPPAVVTESGGSFWWWNAGKGMPLSKVQHLLQRERRLSRRLHYIHPTATPDAATAAFLMVPSARPLFASLGIDADAIRVLPGGVPGPLAPGTERRGEYDGDGGPVTVVFVARQFEVKGGPTVLEIFRRVRVLFGNARLVIAGPPGPDPGLDGVTWLGPVTREQLYQEVYPHADLMIYPTTADAGPRVVEEALAHGIPVVAPAAFGLDDQVDDGRTGILYPPGDTEAAVVAVVGLLKDRPRLSHMAREAADDFARRFSADLRNRLLLEAYEAAAAGAPR